MQRSDVASVILAAGTGKRLRPLTELLPKALCPINNKALVDHAIDVVSAVVSDVAVNASYMHEAMSAHLDGRVHVSIEPEPLGSAGAIGNLRNWIGERAVLVHNADAWHDADLTSFVDGWDGERVRMLVFRDPQRSDFGEWRYCGVSLMPVDCVRQLTGERSGLWARCWSGHWKNGELDLVAHNGAFFDCGTPRDYLVANLEASRSNNVVGPSANVEGRIDRCVVWDGATVSENEDLREVVRAPNNITVDASGLK